MTRLTANNRAIRAAIREVLRTIREPMQAHEIAAHPVMQKLGVSTYEVSKQCSALCKRKKTLFPIARTEVSARRWAYYNPELVTPPQAVNGVQEEVPQAAPTFEFNPVELGESLDRTGQQARSVCISLAGITIRIELQ